MAEKTPKDVPPKPAAADQPPVQPPAQPKASDWYTLAKWVEDTFTAFGVPMNQTTRVKFMRAWLDRIETAVITDGLPDIPPAAAPA